MTPRHILSRWERVSTMLTAQPLYGRCPISAVNAWLAMLHLADVQEIVVRKMAVKMSLSNVYTNSILYWMVKNKLAKTTGGVRGRRPGCNPLRYAPTPLLFEVLGLNPADTTSTKGAAS